MKRTVMTLVILSAFAGSGTATADPVALSLPGPTGSFAVGSTVVPLVDEFRPDPWVPTGSRELMTTVWYPALRTEPSPRPAPYMTEEESAAFVDGLEVAAPRNALATVETRSAADALPLPSWHDRPLVVLSPGFSFPRATLTGLAEELASRGTVVIAVDHTHEARGISLPGGRFADCVACDAEFDGPFVTAGRSRDPVRRRRREVGHGRTPQAHNCGRYCPDQHRRIIES